MTLKVLRRMGRIGRALCCNHKCLRRTGAQVYRYARFFLFTIEYGETVARLKPKVIHSHDLYTLQAAVRIARWIGAEVVYDAHELESDRRAGTKPAMAKWIIDQEKTYAPLATGCVTVSHAIADTMQNDLGVARPTVVFNAPIVLEAPEGFETRTIRADLGLTSDAVVRIRGQDMGNCRRQSENRSYHPRRLSKSGIPSRIDWTAKRSGEGTD
ncbi:MAG: glycosyltransferase [Hyphomicrobium sp.]|nr:glycosyltransferase [Hyphomicrobium sp.]